MIHFVVHGLDSVRLSSGLPASHSTASMLSYGQRHTESAAFSDKVPGNRPGARDLTEQEFQGNTPRRNYKCSYKLRTGREKKKKASKSLGSDKVLASAFISGI